MLGTKIAAVLFAVSTAGALCPHALADEDPGVQEEAAAALRKITARDFGKDRD